MANGIYRYYRNVLMKGKILPFYYRLLFRISRSFGIFARVSLSQFCEDLLLDLIFRNMKKKSGFFVDVGCNHPIEYNNTYLLYLKGWRGINIDANKDLIDLYKKYRNEDTNLNCLISDREEEARFYLASNDKLSSLHKEHLGLVGEEISDDSPYIQMPSHTLNKLLNQSMPSTIDKLDLLCIDVEGHEYQVLQSIDLEKYQPLVIVIELHGLELHNPAEHKVYNWLSQKGYRMHHFVFSNAFFIRERS